MSSLEKKIEKILLEVAKPTRYLGHELNSVRKDHAKIAVKVLLAFPDVYEVGMSHLGLKILYDEINKEKDKLAERTYAPWLDMEGIMRREGIPLFSLENKMPAKSFDVIGFTLQYELSYTNILNMLSLAGIPLQAAERSEGYPLIIGGGPGAFNPEPLAPFFDLFLLGEGEKVFCRLLDSYAAHLKGGGGRDAFLLKAAQIKGIYVPSLYRDKYGPEGDFLETIPVREGVPPRVAKVFVRNLDRAHFPEKYLVPYMG
ncbi:MAG TPA: B12-binding domain-containing radical SAM protein, partial [Firmicutes bacterium]|nr:B12-binding domain-containing radical SAM protein [Bacillota bacterium]